jgi:Flp pilus assembly protein TadG
MSKSRSLALIRSPRLAPRRGSATIEALVVIPLLVIVTFAAFQFTGTIAVEQAVSYAATVGARESSKNATDAEIEVTVENALAPFNIVTGANATIVVERFGLPTSQIGTLVITPPAAPVLAAGETRVTVGVSLSVAPLSRLLASFGLDFSTRQFQASSLTLLQ